MGEQPNKRMGWVNFSPVYWLVGFWEDGVRVSFYNKGW